MAKKQRPVPAPQVKPAQPEKAKINSGSSFRLEIASLPRLTPYLPGILLFLAALVIALYTFHDYGMSWDEPAQRGPGLLSYNYVFDGDQALFTTPTDNHGAGFELLLVLFEKGLHLTDSKDIYEMRHLVTHIFFIVSIFFAYVLIYRLFKNRFLASLGFLMLLLAPRLYAHSFINSKDLPFLSMLLISFACCQLAFEKNKPVLFLILGLVCGYATSIRIMGVMLGSIILLFLLIDLLTDLSNKIKPKKQLLNIALFSIGFVFLLYLGWPYLWKSPVHNFIESFNKLAHFDLVEEVALLNGKYIDASKLPWTYFPIWFLISNPELWLFAGFAGILLFSFDFFKKPLIYLSNTTGRNFLLYLLCFFIPVLAVIVLHSIIYDDWRHLYFVYPPFVLLALYFINKLLQTKYKLIVQAVCILQMGIIGVLMAINHPFNQVYFNYFVSHAPENLRNNFEMEYWGCSFKQGFDHLLNADKSNATRIFSDVPVLLDNNIMMLPEGDRKRIVVADMENADYYFTNFRGHPYDYPPYPVEYSIKVFNSTILSVFKLEKDSVKKKQIIGQYIAALNKLLINHPDDYRFHSELGNAYYHVGQYDSSQIQDKIAADLSPHNSQLMTNLASAYFYIKDYPLAISAFRKAIEMGPGTVSPYANISVCYLYVNKVDSAIYFAKKSVSIDSTYTLAYTVLAAAYKTTGNADSSRKYDKSIK